MNYKRGPGNYKSSWLRTVVKQEDESVGDTTLQDDDELFFKASINTIYNVVIMLFLAWDAAPDFKYALSMPSGATGERNNATWASTAVNTAIDATTVTNLASSTGTRVLQIDYRVIIGSTSGQVSFQWAQRFADAISAKVLKGSMLTVVSG